VRFEFESGTILFCFSFIFGSFGESHLLVSWCAGGRCGIVCRNEDHGRSRRPGVEDQGWSHRSGTRWPGGREAGWRCVRSAPGTWRLGARCDRTTSEMRGLSPKIISGILNEARMHKHTHISIQYHI
jgi:hypothetical protein